MLKPAYNCQSVLGGWQTFSVANGKLFGPVFNKITDLWDWQAKNVYLTPELLADRFHAANPR